MPQLAPEGRPDDERAPLPRANWWRWLTGSLAAGLALLAVAVLGSALVAVLTGAPGPGLFALIAHPVAAVAALSAQFVVDHRRGRAAGGAAIAVVVITGTALWFLWWS